MEPYYYSKMSRPQQAAYHGMLQGLNQLAPEIQLPRLSAEELYDVFPAASRSSGNLLGDRLQIPLLSGLAKPSLSAGLLI